MREEKRGRGGERESMAGSSPPSSVLGGLHSAVAQRRESLDASDASAHGEQVDALSALIGVDRL